MRLQLIVLAIALASVLLTGCASTAQPRATEVPLLTVKKRASVSADVIGIDKENRTVIVRDEDNIKREIRLDERVVLDEIERGDGITVESYELTAVSLRKQSTAAPGVVTTPEVVALAGERDEKPASVVANTIVITGRVENVDPRTREITLTGPRGEVVTVPLGRNARNLEQASKGDQVVVAYSHAIAIDVTEDIPYIPAVPSAGPIR